MTTDLQVFNIYSFQPANNYWSYSTKDTVPLSQCIEVCVFMNSCVCFSEKLLYKMFWLKKFSNPEKPVYFIHQCTPCALQHYCVLETMLFCHIITEKHAGLCDCCGWSSDLAHDESAAESKTLLHSQAAGTNHSQLHTTWLWSFYILQHTGACGWEGKCVFVLC